MDNQRPLVNGGHEDPLGNGDPFADFDSSNVYVEENDQASSVSGDEQNSLVNGDHPSSYVNENQQGSTVSEDNQNPFVNGDHHDSTVSEDNQDPFVNGDHHDPTVNGYHEDSNVNGHSQDSINTTNDQDSADTTSNQESVASMNNQESVVNEESQDSVDTANDQDSADTTDNQESVANTDNQESIVNAESQDSVDVTDNQESSVNTNSQDQIVNANNQGLVVNTNNQQLFNVNNQDPSDNMPIQDPFVNTDSQDPSAHVEHQDPYADSEDYEPFVDSDDQEPLLNREDQDPSESNPNSSEVAPGAPVDSSPESSSQFTSRISSLTLSPGPRDRDVAILYDDFIADIGAATNLYLDLQATHNDPDDPAANSAFVDPARGGRLSVITGSNGPLTHVLMTVKLRDQMPSEGQWQHTLTFYCLPEVRSENLISYVGAWNSQTFLAAFTMPFTFWQCLIRKLAYTLVARIAAPDRGTHWNTAPPVDTDRASNASTPAESIIAVIASTRDLQAHFMSHFTDAVDPVRGYGQTDTGTAYSLVPVGDWSQPGHHVANSSLEFVIGIFKDFLDGYEGHIDSLGRLDGVLFLLDAHALRALRPDALYPDLTRGDDGPIDLGSIGVGVLAPEYDHPAADSILAHTVRHEDLRDAMRAVFRPFHHQYETLFADANDGSRACAQYAVERVLRAGRE